MVDVFSTGVTDHGLPGNDIEASDRDNGINVSNYDNLVGLRMPDAIANSKQAV